MAQEVLSVPEVTCEHCVNALEGAVGALEGVDSVKVDLDRKDITIDYDDARVGHANFVTAITGEGYQVGS
ncbi:MAG TPA: copper ion binding protein [Actinomycetota bacterium]|jgi:copper chaperone